MGRNCKCCKKEFIPTINLRKYCSEQCKNNFYYKNHNKINTKKVCIKKKCEYCGEEFETNVYNKRFCNFGCLTKNTKLLRKNINKLYVCEVCKNTFYAQKERKFCCLECKKIFTNNDKNLFANNKLLNDLERERKEKNKRINKKININYIEIKNKKNEYLEDWGLK
jgi:hypothetical protein